MVMWKKQHHCAFPPVFYVGSDNNDNDSEIERFKFYGSGDECEEDKEELMKVGVSVSSVDGGVPRVAFMRI